MAGHFRWELPGQDQRVDGLCWREAKAVLETARNVDELKRAQAVVLPLERGLTLSQGATALGVSPGWVCRLRRRFERIVWGEEMSKPKRGGRRRELLTPEPEAAFLAPYLEEAKAGGVVVVPPIQVALESHLGRPVTLSTVYRMLHRQGGRKWAPDQRHPKADPAAQEAWKKVPRATGQEHPNLRGHRPPPADVPGRSPLRANGRCWALWVSQAVPSPREGDDHPERYLGLCGALAPGWALG